MRITVEPGGVLRLPEALMERLGIGPGGGFDARVDRGRLVLDPVSAGGDPFADALKRPADDALERAVEREELERRRAREAFDDALREGGGRIDMDREREERDRWR